ncbi:MAG: hypothetical protein Ta2E_06160 [Mycoplasmoidaceae bacterium]|nr:MAG: hypothetical protein Ta2E_06160 [Mycoplasmoidaceae bacterium]
MLICHFLINWHWYWYNYFRWYPSKLMSFKYIRLFNPSSAEFKVQALNRWYSLFVFILFFVLGTLMITIQLICFKYINNIGWISAIMLYAFSIPSFIPFICSYNKNYKLYLKTLKYLDRSQDTKLISYEINKMYYETKILNETQWQLYKFWYIYQKDIPWRKKNFVIIGTRKDFDDKRHYQSDIFELVKDL